MIVMQQQHQQQQQRRPHTGERADGQARLCRQQKREGVRADVCPGRKIDDESRIPPFLEQGRVMHYVSMQACCQSTANSSPMRLVMMEGERRERGRRGGGGRLWLVGRAGLDAAYVSGGWVVEVLPASRHSSPGRRQ